MFKVLVIFVVLAILHSELADAANKKKDNKTVSKVKNVVHAHARNAPSKKNSKQKKKAAPKKAQIALRLRMKPTNRATNDNRCDDKAENCNEFMSWCTEGSYSGILKKYCQKGCGYCAPSGDKCKDSFSDKCGLWRKKGFCKAKFLEKSQIRAMCAKSCEMCGDNKSPTTKKCESKDKKYAKECLEETCAKPEEKGDKQSKECKDWCGMDSNKDKDGCKGASQCSTKEKKYQKECLEETCNTSEEQKTPSKECEAFCKATETKDKCKKAECSTKEKKYQKECLEETCNTSEEQKKPSKECDDFCKADATKDKCKKASPSKECEAADKKYEGECAKETCAKDEEKEKDGCVKYCTNTGKSEKVCDCKDSSNEYKDWCGQETCANVDKKKEDGCNTHCSKAAFKTKDSCKCSVDDNKYKKWCLEETCNSAEEKKSQSADCKKYCDDNAGKCK